MTSSPATSPFSPAPARQTRSIHHAPGASFDEHDRVAPGDIAVGVVIGRASEYFDFFVYGIASALVFPSVFFPFANRLEGILYAFVLFAFAFVVRPLGTLVGMEIQRRFGRSTKLTVALFLLGCSTAGMALLPGYASLGTLSIALLALFRVGQGLALGASWDGLPSLLALNAPAPFLVGMSACGIVGLALVLWTERGKLFAGIDRPELEAERAEEGPPPALRDSDFGVD